MIRGLFKEKKISVFYLVVLIGFSLFQVYLFFVLFQFVRYSLDSYYYLKVYLNPQIYSDDPSFLSLFSSSLQEGWNSIKEGSPFFSSEIKYIISSSVDEVYKNTFIFLVAIITSFVSFLIINIFSTLFTSCFQYSLRRRIDEKVFLFNRDELLYKTSLSLVNSVIYDLANVSFFIKEFFCYLPLSIFLLIFSISSLFYMNIVSGIIVLSFSLIFIITMTVLLLYSIRYENNLSSSHSNFSYILKDLLLGKDDSYFNSFDYVIGKNIKKEIDKNYSIKVKKDNISFFYRVFLFFAFYSEIILTLLISLLENRRNSYIIYIIFLVFAIYYSFILLERIYIDTPSYISCRRNIKSILSKNDFKEDKNIFSKKMIGEIVFSHVSFRYPGRKNYVLKDVSFVISRSMKSAILGRSGSGKSTILKLMRKEYLPESGEIYIDGVNIKDIPRTSLYSIISTMFEEDYLLSSSLNYNISLGNTMYSKENFSYAYQVSLLNNDNIFKNTDDLSHLSSGNIRQIHLARAIIPENEILILDSPFSSIDNKSAKTINEKILLANKDKTILYITNHVDVLKKCDVLFFLEDGKISFVGDYEQFKKSIPSYSEVFYGGKDEL